MAVPADAGRSNLCVAIQAPVMRASAATAKRWLPPLRRAARALSAIDAGTAPPLRAAPRAKARA